MLQNLQFGQGYDITILWLVPDGLLRRCVVIVEAIGLRVKKLPPLRRVGPLNWDILQTKEEATLD